MVKLHCAVMVVTAIAMATASDQECPQKNQPVVALLPQWGRMGEHGAAFRAMHPTLGQNGLQGLYDNHLVRQGFYTYGALPYGLGNFFDAQTQCLNLDLDTVVGYLNKPQETGDTEYHAWDAEMAKMKGVSSNSYAVWRILTALETGTRVIVAIVSSDFEVTDYREHEYRGNCEKPVIPSRYHINSYSRFGNQKIVVARMKKNIRVDLVGKMEAVTLDVDGPPESMFDEVREIIAKMKKYGAPVKVDVVFEPSSDLELNKKVMNAPWISRHGEFAEDEFWRLTYTKVFSKDESMSCFRPAGSLGLNRFSVERIRSLPEPKSSAITHAVAKAIYDAGSRRDRPEGPLLVFVNAGIAPKFGTGNSWNLAKTCHREGHPSWKQISELLRTFDARLILATENNEAWLEAVGENDRVMTMSYNRGYEIWLDRAKRRFVKPGQSFMTAMVVGHGEPYGEHAKVYWEVHDPKEFAGFLAWTHSWNGNDSLTGETCYIEHGWKDGLPLQRNTKAVGEYVDDEASENPATYAIMRMIADPSARGSVVQYVARRRAAFAENGGDRRDWGKTLCIDRVLPTAMQFRKALEKYDIKMVVTTNDEEIRKSWEVVRSSRISFNELPPAAPRMFYLADGGHVEDIMNGFSNNYINTPIRDVGVIGKWEHDGRPGCMVAMTSGTALKTTAREIVRFDDRGEVAALGHLRDPYLGGRGGAEAALLMTLQKMQTDSKVGGALVMFVDRAPRFSYSCGPRRASGCQDYTAVCVHDVGRVAGELTVSKIIFVSDNQTAGLWVEALSGDTAFPLKLQALELSSTDCATIGERINEAVCNLDRTYETDMDCLWKKRVLNWRSTQ